MGTTETFGGISGADPTIHSYELYITTTGVITIRIKNVGSATSTNRQVTIDNVKWSATSVLNPEP